MKVLLQLTLSLLVVCPAANAANFAREPKTQPRLEQNDGINPRALAADAIKGGHHDDDPVSFGGTWKTIAGGSTRYTVILNQVGDKVTGSYSPGNGKIFDGVVTDQKLTFKWTQDGGYEGTGEFTMDQDGKGFKGSSTAVKPKAFSVSWESVKTPVASFAGTWDTMSNGAYPMQLTIVQNGDRVTGIYPSHSGKIEGTVVGRVLRFKWESDGGKGSGRLVMEESGKVFSGTYNQGDDSDEVEATWNGQLHVSFAGTWTWSWQITKASSVTFIFKIQQSGTQVTGYAYDTRKEAEKYYFKDATVSGNTLTYDIEGTPGLFGQLVMADDGKSFKGNMGPNKLVATLSGP
jgi:hypothetical protein